jgi:hypothetical protein
MTNNLHEVDEFPFIHHQLGVARRQGSAEERNKTDALVKNRADARLRGIAFHDEDGVERQQLQHRSSRQGELQGDERELRLRRSLESFLPQEPGEGLGYGTKVLDEAAVITRQAKERTHHPHRARN